MLVLSEYGEGTSIPKAKSVNQSFHTSAECAFLYAGLNTYLPLQVNVTENNRILRDGFSLRKGAIQSTLADKLKTDIL